MKSRFLLFETVHATSSVLSPSKCTKIVGSWGFASEAPLWELTALPRPLAGLRGLLLRGGEKEGRGRNKEGVEGGTLDRHNVGNRLVLKLKPAACDMSRPKFIVITILATRWPISNHHVHSLTKFLHL